MYSVLLLRHSTSDEGTFGTFEVFDEEGTSLLTLYSGELPWRDNAVGKSCIPAKEYFVTPYSSRKYPNHFLVNDVPGRSAILIHQGNWCGDKAKGFLSNVQGCILVGKSYGVAKKQKAVLNSLLALDMLRAIIGRNEFILRIKDKT